MKLKYKKCLEILEKNTNTKPTHTQISKIINVSANALSNRLSNNGYLNDEEVDKIQNYYKIDLLKSNESINVTYYSNYNELNNLISKHTIDIPLNCFDNFSKYKKYFAINATGDTMSPFIKDNDKLIIEYYTGEQIRDNRIYIFKYNDEFFIKRLIKNIDQIVIKSDNDIYPIRFIDTNSTQNLSIIGQIVGLIRNAD